MPRDRWTTAIETGAPERETTAERLKIMLKMGGLRMADRDHVECFDAELMETALRRAKVAGLILRRRIGWTQGRTLLLWVLPPEEALGRPNAAPEADSCAFPGERATCAFPLCTCPVPRP
jgi:hypothetical protein